MHQLAVPPLKVPYYRTTGTYPQLTRAGLDLTNVNAALKRTVTVDQAAYRVQVLQQLKEVPSLGYTGTYDLAFDPTLIVANTAVVSTMFPSLKLYPGGNDGSGWLDATLLVPSGAPVALRDLFPTGATWLRTLAGLTRAETERGGFCAPDRSDDASVSAFNEGLAPTQANYQHFAVTADGLDIGLEQGQIGAEACGAGRITIPWQQLSANLSTEGQRLATAARQGLSTAPCSLLRLNRAFDQRSPVLHSLRQDETGMRVSDANCVPGWALATAQPSGIPEYDKYENLLFKSSGRDWVEVAVLPAPADFSNSEVELAWCDLIGHGVPLAAAKRLIPYGQVRPSGRSCT